MNAHVELGDAEEVDECGHPRTEVEFDVEAAKDLNAAEVRKRWPRFFGECPDCGQSLIRYASFAHFAMGDW